MPTFLIIVIEVFVRLIITLLLVLGAYAAFTAKRSHKFWGTLAAICALATTVNIFIPSSYTPGNRITFTHTYTSEQAKAHHKTKNTTHKKKETQKLTESEKFDSESESMEKQESKAEKQAQAASSSRAESESKSNTVKVGNIPYEKVSLVDFTEDPDKYDGKNIQTSGQILMIQRNPDDKNMYFVVIAPTDSHTSSGYADGHGTVAQIDIDTMQEGNLSQGQNITVNGGGLEGQVTFNGKTVSTSIIVDSVTVN